MSHELWSDKGAICPHCNHLNAAADDNWSLYDENLEGWECSECGQEFDVSAYAKWSWQSEPTKAEAAE